MKKTVLYGCVLVLSLASLLAQKETAVETFSSVDPPARGKPSETFPPGLLKFTDGDLTQVLSVYQELSGRTIVRSTSLPTAKITIASQTPLTRIEALQALDSVLAQNGIVMIPQGIKFVKAVSKQAVAQESAPFVDLPAEQLPDSGTYIAYIVQVKNRKPRDLAQALQPFAALPNSILGLDDPGLIILRDFSSNVRRMLQVLERIENSPPPDEAKPKKSATKRNAGKASRDRGSAP
jgi:general secretion pathway protein D